MLTAMSSYYAFLSYFLAALTGATVSLVMTHRKANAFPPGPSALPVIGNILKVSPKGAWERFMEYKVKYGESN